MSGSADPIRVWGPASLSNLGPGFDALGMCLHGLGDVVEVTRIDGTGIEIQLDEGAGLPVDPARNTAGVAARAVIEQLGHPGGFSVRIAKGVHPGSGLGSSAASAVAAAWATYLAAGGTGGREDVIGAALSGEQLVSGARHGDNVLPSLLGGLILTSPADAESYRIIDLPHDPVIALVRPSAEILTRDARAVLPDSVDLERAVRNAAMLAMMVDAFRSGDLEFVGSCMERDLLVEPVRSRFVPGFHAIREAARGAGAFGCALSGSGPALFALCPDENTADRVRLAMVDAAGEEGVRSAVARIDRIGARTTEVGWPGVVL